MMSKGLQVCLLLLMVGRLQGEYAMLKNIGGKTHITASYRSIFYHHHFVFFGHLRQCKSTTASGSPSGEAFYSNLQRVEGPRWDSEASALAGCPKPDTSELSARPKRQCEWTAACGACLLHQRHFGYHHPQGGLPRWRLLHLHLWHASIWIETGTDLPHCYRWVRPLRTAAALDKTYVTVHTVTLMGSA